MVVFVARTGRSKPTPGDGPAPERGASRRRSSRTSYTSLLHEHDETGCGNDHVQLAAGRSNDRASVADVLATVSFAVAVEDFLPATVRDLEPVLLHHVAVRERAVVQARQNDRLFVTAPSFERDHPVRVRHVENVDVATADRREPAR